MPARRKSWREKLHASQEARVVDDPRGRGRMLIPRPLEVDALVHQVERGRLVTVEQIRAHLAREHRADFTCPLVTGIFLRIIGEAAEEDRDRGESEVTPYWRVVRDDGSLNDKFPGGVEAQAARLGEEGHTIEPGKGKKPPRVIDFKKALQDKL